MFRLDGSEYVGIAIPKGLMDPDTIFSVGLVEAVADFAAKESTTLFTAKKLGDLPLPVMCVSSTETADYMRALDNLHWLRINLGESDYSHTVDAFSGDIRVRALDIIWDDIIEASDYFSDSMTHWANEISENIIMEVAAAISGRRQTALTLLGRGCYFNVLAPERRIVNAIQSAASIFSLALTQCKMNANVANVCATGCECFQTSEVQERRIAITPYEYPNHVLADVYPNAVLSIRPEFDAENPKRREPDRFIMEALWDSTAEGMKPRWALPYCVTEVDEFLKQHPGIQINPGRTVVSVPTLDDLLEMIDGENPWVFLEPTEWGSRTTHRVQSAKKGFVPALTEDQIAALPVQKRARYNATVRLVEALYPCPEMAEEAQNQTCASEPVNGELPPVKKDSE